MERGLTQIEEIRGKFLDFLPTPELFPDLSPEEVERFVAAGLAGRERSRAGDVAGAESAYREQISIFPLNHEPWLHLAMIEAGRGAGKEAREYLCQAVWRGFRDLRGLERAEAWSGMRRTVDYLDLVDALPVLEKMERDWPSWNISVPYVPKSLAAVLSEQARWTARVEAMAPALGPRLVDLWTRVVDRVAAASLESYVLARPDAPDFDEALDRTLGVYAGGVLARWERIPAEAATRLARISDLTLERSPESPMRPAALLAGAIARFAERDDRDLLDRRAGQKIFKALDEITNRHADSPLVAPAIVGLVRTETDLRRPKAAAARYRKFLAENTARPELVEKVREDLGETALRLGGLPDFRATTLDGRTIERETLRGNVVVLDFWATWCGPCTQELPTLRRIDERFGEDVVLLGVNLDDAQEISPDALRLWIDREQVPGDQVHDGLSWESALVRAFGVKEIPFSVVIGPEGDVLAVNQRGKEMEKTVRAAVRAAGTRAAVDDGSSVAEP